MDSFFIFLDPLFIAPYRLASNALIGFFLGTWCLVMGCILLGDASQRTVARINQSYLNSLQKKMEHYHHLSEKALSMGDKTSYKAINKQAHDAFGHYFSLGATLCCVSIWPLPFAIGWMDFRFTNATPSLPWDIPIIGQQPTVVFWFLLLYIPMRIVYGKCVLHIRR